MELEHPVPRKHRIIYGSRQLTIPKTYGEPILCDFGAAVYGNTDHEEDVQPDVYRAPEVILEMKWSYSIDIWNVGTMVGSKEIHFLDCAHR